VGDAQRRKAENLLRLQGGAGHFLENARTAPCLQDRKNLERNKRYLITKINEQGHITAKVPLWWELPEVTLRREIGNTEYSISGSYDGSHTLPSKLLRLMEQEAEEQR